MAARVELNNDNAGDFRCRLNVANAEGVLESQGYSAKAVRKNGI